MSDNSTFYKCCIGSKENVIDTSVENKFVENIQTEKEGKKQEQNTVNCLSFFGFCYEDNIKHVNFNNDYQYVEKTE